MSDINLEYRFDASSRQCKITGQDSLSNLFALYLEDIYDECLILDFLDQPEKYNFGLGCNHDIFIFRRNGGFVVEGEIFNPITEGFDFYSFPFEREALEDILADLRKFKEAHT